MYGPQYPAPSCYCYHMADVRYVLKCGCALYCYCTCRFHGMEYCDLKKDRATGKSKVRSLLLLVKHFLCLELLFTACILVLHVACCAHPERGTTVCCT